jgi:hypothetical protein
MARHKVRFDSTKPSTELYRDALFGTPLKYGSPRRRGTIEGCWGWSDVQIGSLRLSFLDFRPTYFAVRDFYTWLLICMTLKTERE